MRGGLEARLAGGRKCFGKCLHDRAEGDGVALREVAGPDVAIHRVFNDFTNNHGRFAVVGQGPEGAGREMRNHGCERLGDFAIEIGVLGKEPLLTEGRKAIEDRRESQDGFELGVFKNPKRLFCAHTGRAQERVFACGGGMIQDGLDDRFGATVGNQALLAGSRIDEVADRFLNFQTGMAGQLAEDCSGGAGVVCVGKQDARLEIVLVAFVEIISKALRSCCEVALGDTMLATIDHEFIKNILRNIGMCENLVLASSVGKPGQIGQNLGKHSRVVQ